MTKKNTYSAWPFKGMCCEETYERYVLPARIILGRYEDDEESEKRCIEELFEKAPEVGKMAIDFLWDEGEFDFLKKSQSLTA